MKKTSITTKSVEETKKIGKKFAQKLMEGGVVCLFGELGSGKTSFTQGLAEGLGIKRRVNSPTFIIMRSYEIPLLFEPQRELTRRNFSPSADGSKNKRFFYHLDLYRIASERDVEGLGIKEILEDSTNIIVIEWAERIEKILPEKRTNIYFNYLSDDQRSIVIHEN